MILVFSYNIDAEAGSKTGLEFNGGLTYNNYLYKKYDIQQGERNLDDGYFIREDLHQGTGYYIEAIYWKNSQLGIGLGLQKNKMIAEWESDSNTARYKANLDSYYSSLIYSLNYTLDLYIDINYNLYNENYSKEDFSTVIKSGAGLGMMLGSKMNYPLNENIDLLLNTGYYLADIHIDEKYSSYQGEVINVDDEVLLINGLGIKFGIKYKF